MKKYIPAGFSLFRCKGRDQFNSCHFGKYKFIASETQHEYKLTLVESRSGINSTMNRIRTLGTLIKPLLEQGLSLYSILEIHPEIHLTEKTLYTYIETGIFQNAGISVCSLDLRSQVGRKFLSYISPASTVLT